VVVAGKSQQTRRLPAEVFSNFSEIFRKLFARQARETAGLDNDQHEFIPGAMADENLYL